MSVVWSTLKQRGYLAEFQFENGQSREIYFEMGDQEPSFLSYSVIRRNTIASQVFEDSPTFRQLFETSVEVGNKNEDNNFVNNREPDTDVLVPEKEMTEKRLLKGYINKGDCTAAGLDVFFNIYVDFISCLGCE